MKTTKRNDLAWTIRAKRKQEQISFPLAGEVSIVAAEAGKGPPTFTMVAYTGGKMRPHVQPRIPHPVVVDLDSLELPHDQIPALKDHKAEDPVGHVEKITVEQYALRASGIVSGVGPNAREVVGAAANGYKWRVSMGAMFRELDFIPGGRSVFINARTIKGPVYVARNGRLRELSFLSMAADDDTSATIAAEAAKEPVMDFAAWLKANGFQPEDQLNDAQLVILRARYKASKGESLGDEVKVEIQAMLDSAAEEDGDGEEGNPRQRQAAPAKRAKKKGKRPFAVAAAASRRSNDPIEGDDDDDDPNVELTARLARLERQQQILLLCGEKHTDIAQKALDGNWDDDVIKMAIRAADLEASMPKSIHIRTGRAKDAPAQGLVLEAACAIAGNLSSIEDQYDERALNEAASSFRHGISLQELLLNAAHAHGYTGYSVRQDVRGVLEAAFGYRMQAAQFSTVSLPGIMSNVANKFLLEGFTYVETVWRSIAAIRPVNDFKTVTSYRLLDGGEFEEIGPGGMIPHGKLGEESFTNRAKSWGKMLGITYQDIVNDDMGALTVAPRTLGRGDGIKLNKVFWATFLDDATFFADPSQNYLKGAGTALSSAGLDAATQKFRAKVDHNNNKLAIEPRILLTPPSLEFTAAELMGSTTVNTGGASTSAKVPNKNVWANKYQPVTSAYLTAEKVWYLLADPRDVPVIEVAFLNGQQQPTVESTDADFNTLGILMRGTHHWGVSKQDARGGLKVKGEA